MKKNYITPSVLVVKISLTSILSGSIEGIEGTGNFSTTLSGDDETDEYLSRFSYSMLDDNDDEF